MFIKTRREPWHGPPTPDARKPRIHRDGARSKPSSNKPIHNDKQHQRRAELFAHCKSLQSARRPSLQPTPLACATRAAQFAPGAKPRSPTRKPSTAKRGTSPGAQIGGGERNRTVDLLLAKQALSQLSYTPGQKSEIRCQKSDPYDDEHLYSDLCLPASGLVGRGGLEPPTSRLSSARSNQLSYQPDSEVRYQ